MTNEIGYAVGVLIVQEQIIRTLQQDDHDGLTMSDLVQRVRQTSPQSTIGIRSAVLPLIMVGRVEFTPERKLRLNRV
ncbi:MAG: hypothetical protein ABSH09_13170 [Bryobacteraceae bacterium]|jgi:hypothetical protein